MQVVCLVDWGDYIGCKFVCFGQDGGYGFGCGFGKLVGVVDVGEVYYVVKDICDLFDWCLIGYVLFFLVFW